MKVIYIDRPRNKRKPVPDPEERRSGLVWNTATVYPAIFFHFQSIRSEFLIRAAEQSHKNIMLLGLGAQNLLYPGYGSRDIGF